MSSKTSIFIALLIIGIILAGVWLQKDKQENTAKKTDCVNFNEPLENVSETYKILLKFRTFIPPEGIECSLLNKSETSENIHIILQFYAIPDIPERNELGTMGVSLVGYIPQMSFFASVPSSEKRLREIKNLSYVRWMGDVLPEDKLYEGIRNNQIGDWAIDEKGNALLQIMFHDDISQEQIKSTVNNYGTINDDIGMMNTVVASVPKEKIFQLAEEDAVKWIETVPPPATTDRQSD